MYAHSHIHSHARTHTLTQAHSHTHSHTHTLTHSHTHTHTLSRMHAHSQAHTHALVRTLTRTHAHTHTHAHSRTHTHTHSHTLTEGVWINDCRFSGEISLSWFLYLDLNRECIDADCVFVLAEERMWKMRFWKQLRRSIRTSKTAVWIWTRPSRACSTNRRRRRAVGSPANHSRRGKGVAVNDLHHPPPPLSRPRERRITATCTHSLLPSSVRPHSLWSVCSYIPIILWSH